MTSGNYNKGAAKSYGGEVRVNEYRDLDPNDLPAVGDYVLLKTRAHRLVEVLPRAELIEVPDATTFVPIDRPDAVTDAILDAISAASDDEVVDPRQDGDQQPGFIGTV